MLSTLACVACSSPTKPPEGSPYLTTVNLPLALAGIGDARQPFATWFEQELAADGSVSQKAAAVWLWGAAPGAVSGYALRQTLQAAFVARAPSTSVLVVPGLFGDCFGDQSVPYGDGLLRTREASLTEAYRQYDDLGLLGVRALSVPGRASSAANGSLLADAIRSEAARPGVVRIVIVAYSKGVADALHALAQLQAEGGVPPAVTALVSIAGVIMGTPLADQLDDVFRSLSPLVQPFGCSASEGLEVASVTRRERAAWLAKNPPPAGVRYYSIVAHAPRDEIAWALRPSYALLSAGDLRNDGQLYASDSILPGSVLLAEARADHWDVALPRDRHPSPAMRALTSGRAYPREALFRAVVKWVVGS